MNRKRGVFANEHFNIIKVDNNHLHFINLLGWAIRDGGTFIGLNWLLPS